MYLIHIWLNYCSNPCVHSQLCPWTDHYLGNIITPTLKFPVPVNEIIHSTLLFSELKSLQCQLYYPSDIKSTLYGFKFGVHATPKFNGLAEFWRQIQPLNEKILIHFKKMSNTCMSHFDILASWSAKSLIGLPGLNKTGISKILLVRGRSPSSWCRCRFVILSFLWPDHGRNS